MSLGTCMSYIIGLMLALIGFLTNMCTDYFGFDNPFYGLAQILLHYHCGLCSARWWPCLRQDCHFLVKLFGFLGPSIFLGLLLSPWVIGPAYTVSCGNKGQKISKAILLASIPKSELRYLPNFKIKALYYFE